MILHGLFGSSDNWHTLARRWGEHFQVYALDLRNHGSSPHESAMNYEEMVQDIEAFLQREGLEEVNIIGHSLGGKVAMLFSSRHLDLVNSLVVLDIGMAEVQGKHIRILEALEDLHPEEYRTRDSIEEMLNSIIQSKPIRKFLMKNILRRVDGSFSWKFNRDALVENYAVLTAALNLDESYMGPTLFLRGENSDYLKNELSPELLQHFPMAQIKTILNAGHWLHAEQSDTVYSEILEFLK